jgi:type I restriction enzyme M protein
MARAKSAKANSSANLSFEAKLWLAADKLRSNMDAAEYKHVVLGLIFLKYISDAFEEHHATLLAGKGEYAAADPENPDEYKALNVFWVPPGARGNYLQNSAKQPEIRKIVDDAMVAIERDNPPRKGVLPKEYARPALDKHRLGKLIDLTGTINLLPGTARDSRVAIGDLADLPLAAETPSERYGNKGKHESFDLLGRIYDLCCGSGGMFVQSEKFVEAHGGKLGEIMLMKRPV